MLHYKLHLEYWPKNSHCIGHDQGRMVDNCNTYTMIIIIMLLTHLGTILLEINNHTVITTANFTTPILLALLETFIRDNSSNYF